MVAAFSKLEYGTFNVLRKKLKPSLVPSNTDGFTATFMPKRLKKDTKMKARITVTLKNGVLDPQGKAIEHALDGLGFQGVDEARQGKLIELDLQDTDKDAAMTRVTEMCEKLLANTVIENYSIELE